MGLSFFNAERAKKARLEEIKKDSHNSLEEPTSPELIGVEVGQQEKVEEIAVKPTKKKRK